MTPPNILKLTRLGTTEVLYVPIHSVITFGPLRTQLGSFIDIEGCGDSHFNESCEEIMRQWGLKRRKVVIDGEETYHYA